MAGEQVLLVRHHAPLRTVGEAESLGVLSVDELALPRRDIVVDTRPFHEDVEGGHWGTSHAYIRQTAGDIRAAADATETVRVLYFSMAEVPHVLALGAYVGDERHVQVHDYDRDTDTWAWPEERQTLGIEVEGLPGERVAQSGPVVVRIEVSYPISDADLDAVVSRERLADVRIRPAGGRDPAPGIVRSTEDVQVVRLAFRETLAAILEARPATEIIHLFVAAPVSVCFVIGQELRLRNGRNVQTYRYRRVDGEKAYRPAVLLTVGGLREVEAPLTPEEVALAASLRGVWQRALDEVIRYSVARREEMQGIAQHWYDYLEPRAPIREVAPFPGLRPIWEMVDERDSVSEAPRAEDYAFDKDDRVWRLSDRLLLSMFHGSGGDGERLRELIRLFLFHEYLHDWQDLTKYTAEDVGSFANCLERIDYLADTYGILHQLDFTARRDPSRVPDERAMKDFIREQIDHALQSFWAFEPSPPHFEWQERRLRRYLNWFWRRVQVREAPNLQNALRTLAQQPVVEVAGLQYRTGRGRIFVVLNEARTGDVLEIGLVLEDGRFFRRGSSTDLSIQEAMEAFGRQDHEALGRFFNSLFEHVRQTGAALPPDYS